jgi:hypothetical protein
MRVLITATLIAISYLLVNAASVYAQCTGCAGVCVGNSYCVEQPVGSNVPADGALAFYVGRFYQFTLPIAGIIGFILIMYSGFLYLTSKGDPKAVQSAQLRLTYAIGGLIILFLAYSVLGLITFMLNLRQP